MAFYTKTSCKVKTTHSLRIESYIPQKRILDCFLECFLGSFPNIERCKSNCYNQIKYIASLYLVEEGQDFDH